MRPQAIFAVFKRNFAAYFGSPAAYVFITIFIVASAFLAFSSEAFFSSNIADLSALNSVYHWLLVIFVPAVTMSLWAEERKLGTDELLFTLPVRDIEVVLGKYLAALGVYTVALVFMLSHTLVLELLGNPDWGLLAANYMGYWFLGAGLIALGMVASSLTHNNTVAFILGVTFCFAAVYVEDVAAAIFGPGSAFAKGAGMQAHFRNFTYGVIALPDVIYYALFIAVMLYVNMVLIGRRHWSSGRDNESMGWHFLLRAACVVVAAVALSVLAGRWTDTVRADTTAEDLNSFSGATVGLLDDLPADRTVYIQAFVTPEVPMQYVEVRRSLLRMLNQFDAVGGAQVIVTVHDTPLFSAPARLAEERFGILPAQVIAVEEGSVEQERIYLHVVVTGGPREEIINFADRGLSPEYELARSIRTVAQGERRVVGILRTDVKLFGGFDMQTMRPEQPWAIVEELRKQYDVRQAEPDQPISEDIDVLVAPLPSSLSPDQMDNLAAYVTSGRPVLMLIDPLPSDMPQLSPSQPKAPQQSPYGPQQGPPQEKGDITGLLYRMGLEWLGEGPGPQGMAHPSIVWDAYNPLPRYRELPPEFVFVTRKQEDEETTLKPQFAPDTAVTGNLQVVLMMFPGALNKAPDTPLAVEPLLRTSAQSGELAWEQILSRGFFGMQMNPNRPHRRTGRQYVLAMRVTGDLPDQDVEAPDEATDAEGDPEKVTLKRSVNAVVVADLDMIGDAFFRMRQAGDRETNFDNINFVLNCADQLAGDTALIALRNRRPQYRTLVSIEEEREAYQQQLLEKEKQAETEAADALAEAQARLDEKVEKLKARTDIDERTRQTLLYTLQETEQKRLDAAKKAIEAQKEETVYRAQQTMKEEIRRIERNARLWAIVLPPLPAIAVGLLVFLRMWFVERRETPLTRSMRKRQ